MGEESTTDLHPAKQRRRDVVKQTSLSTGIATLLLGVPGFYLRSRDIERMEARQDRMEEATRINSSGYIELKADYRNMGEKVDRIDRNVEGMRATLDTIRDRIPR